MNHAAARQEGVLRGEWHEPRKTKVERSGRWPKARSACSACHGNTTEGNSQTENERERGTERQRIREEAGESERGGIFFRC